MSISTSIQTNYKINDTDLGDILVSKTYIMSTYRSFIENNTIPDAFWWGVHWPISSILPKDSNYYYYRGVNKFPRSFIGEISDISISQGSASGQGYTQRNMIFLMKDGTIWGCGANQYKSLGQGNNSFFYRASANNGSPYQIGTDNDWVHISSGDEHTMAIKRNGSLWGWGNNSFGQMGAYGNSTYAGSWGVPANIGNEIRYADGSGTYPYYLTQWKYVACGDSFTLFIDYVGQLWSAGSNINGKLGISASSSTSRGYLTFVNAGPWKYVHAGEDSWIGIKENGRLYGCGDLFDSNSPVELGPTSGETWIHCHLNLYHWVAIRSDGTLWTGGIYNINSSNDNSVFGQEEGASISYTSKDTYGIKALGGPYRYAACGYLSTMAIGANGKLYGWGNNQDLQIQPTFDSWIHGPIESPYSTPYTNWKLIRGTDFGYIGLRSTQYI
jgi:alpha-tubulin suppressor-like RCC1 family protein